MPDYGDERVVNAERAQAGRELQRRQIHWRRLMADRAGRDFVWWLLEQGHIFASSYRGDNALQMAWREGQRALILPIMHEIIAADAANYTLMTVEHSNVEKVDAGTE